MSETTESRGFWKDNSLSLVFGGLFLLVLVGQALSGWQDINDQLRQSGLQTESFLHYLTTSDFAVDVTENWQSEYLQFLLFLFGAVWLIQRGSPESKEPGKEGLESDKDQLFGPFARPESPPWAHDTGWRGRVFSRSLGIVMALIFIGSWCAQSIAGWASFNAQQLRDQMAPLSWWGYVTAPDFWNRTLQNWQSELLAVGSFSIFAVYLRQRGSSQSKPVGAAHTATSVEG